MGADNFAQGAAGIALAANALAEAAQALSEAAAALSDMSRDFEPSSAVYSSLDNSAQVTKNQVKIDEDPLQENDDDDASSVGANTGNNAYRRDTSPLDPYTPGTPHTYYTPITINAQEQPRSFGEQKQLVMTSLDEIIFPGHFYIVLEEDFDALPLILAYATAGKRTVCYVPTSGSLIPWESIMSSVIPDRQVRSAVSMTGSNIMPLGEVIEEFVSSNEGSVLVLRPTFIGRVNETRAHSAGDSLIVWGIPGQKFWPGTIQAVQQSKHTLFILSHREFHNPNRQAFFKRLGPDFTVHPRHLALNSFGPGSVITSFRENVQRTISRAQHSQNIQSIYEELLESSINDTTHLHFMAENSAERIEVVNKFAARVFLRGRAQDGSPKFALSGQGLQIPDKTHRRLGALFGTRVQPSQNRPNGNLNPNPMTNQKNTPVTNPPIAPGNDPGAQLHSPAPRYGIERPVTFSKHSGRWYITLQQESDVIPLIRHLANEHPKSICVISHSQSAFAYGDIFDPLSRFSVIRSGKKARSIEDALAKFSQWGVPSGLCLLRGIASSTGNESLHFRWATGDALIYWGLPPQDSFLWPVSVATTQFAHVYVITPSAQLPTVTSLIGDAFQAHPDSPLVNEQGPGSLLYHSREVCKQTLASLPRSTINNIMRFYQPVHPPVYFSREFIMKTMPWVNF